MRPKIFVCYRRQPAGGHAGRIRDDLADRFGKDQIFQDVTSLRAGARYRAEIEGAIATASVFLVVIHQGWSSHHAADGTRALDHPDDFVRLEIRAALSAGVRTIPVLIQGAKESQLANLPSDIASLAERQSRELRDTSWSSDMKALSDEIATIVPTRLKRILWIAAAVALVAMLAGAGFYRVRHWTSHEATTTTATTATTATTIAGTSRTLETKNEPVPSLPDFGVPANVRALTGPLIGIDMLPGRIEWQSFETSTIDFAYVAFVPSKKEQFQVFWSDLRQHGIRRGAYLTFYPARDPIKQADTFVEAVRLLDDDLPPTVDLEATLLEKANLSPAEIGAKLRACLQRLEARTGRRPIIYTVRTAWRSEYGDFSMYPLWVARITKTAPLLPLPGNWTNWKIWQVALETNVPALGVVDVDYFNGNRDAIDAFIAQSRVPH